MTSTARTTPAPTGFAGMSGATGGAAGTGEMAAGIRENLVCFDVFDCALWHPAEFGPCAFTKCEAFIFAP